MKNKLINNIPFITAIIFVVSFGAGCKKEFFEKKLYGIQDQTTTIRDEATALALLGGCYALADGAEWYSARFQRMMLECSTDDGWGGNDYQDRPTEIGTMGFTPVVNPDNTYIQSFYDQLYVAVRNCNTTIIVIPGTPIDENLKKRIVAEAKFLRAYYYFELVKTFGDCVLFTDLPKSTDFIPRSPVADVYAQIKIDLQEAAADLPEKNEYSATDKGRATKGAALSMLAKIFLFTQDYVNAETTALQVIQSNLYSLLPDYGDLWKTTNPWSEESIFEIGFNPDTKWNVGTRANTMNWGANDGGWGWFGLTSNLEKAFIDENDSIRRVWTINKAGAKIAGEDRILPNYDGTHTSGRYFRKLYVPIADRGGVYGNVPLNQMIMRYAELLLIYAEACAFNNKPQEAINALKQVRDRVKLTTDMGLQGDALKLAIWNERRLELAGERTYRWDDIRRIEINGEKLINKLMGPSGSFVIYNTQQNTDPVETMPHRESLDKGINFKPGVNEIWPIPRTVIQATGGIVTQNNGY